MAPDPRPVTEGSRLGIIAPSGPFDRDAFAAGLDWLRGRYEVCHAPDIFEREGYFAGSDVRRLREVRDALRDPSIDAILCARGGYGATRLLPDLDPTEIAGAGKTIIGFSDVTALHATWRRAGLPSIHAPMVAALGRAPDPVRAGWIDTVEHPDRERSWDLTRIAGPASGGVEGILFGGNLAVLGALNGTGFLPDLDGLILFLEDVGERPYRIDRMLTSLAQSGWFDRIAGLVLGSFTEGEPGADGVSVDGVFERRFADAAFPVLTGFPAGHIDDNTPIPFGRPAAIERETLRICPQPLPASTPSRT